MSLIKNTTEILIKAPIDSLGEVSRVIQSRKGDFLSIDQEGDALLITVEVKSSDTENINNDLKKILGSTFSIKTVK